MWMDNWVLNTPVEFWPLYKQQKCPILFRFFETKKEAVVLSSSNDQNKEANVEACKEKNVPILRRKGGGGTVVLGSGCLVLTLAFYARDLFGNSKYFNMINQLWIDAISLHLPVTLSQKGISDICYEHKKVAGTSIFRKKNLLVYQGSLLVDANIENISNLLCHPTKEPDYRHGRSHQDFLATLRQLGCKITAQELAIHCQKYFNTHASAFFKNELLYEI